MLLSCINAKPQVSSIGSATVSIQLASEILKQVDGADVICSTSANSIVISGNCDKRIRSLFYQLGTSVDESKWIELLNNQQKISCESGSFNLAEQILTESDFTLANKLFIKGQLEFGETNYVTYQLYRPSALVLSPATTSNIPGGTTLNLTASGGAAPYVFTLETGGASLQGSQLLMPNGIDTSKIKVLDSSCAEPAYAEYSTEDLAIAGLTTPVGLTAVTEGQSYSLNISLSKELVAADTLQYEIWRVDGVSGSATSLGNSQTFNLSSGVKSFALNLTAPNDNIYRAQTDKLKIRISKSSADAKYLVDSSAAEVIVNLLESKSAPSVTIPGDLSVNEGETISLGFTMSEVSGSEVSFDYSIEDLNTGDVVPASGFDYNYPAGANGNSGVIRIAAGQTSASLNFESLLRSGYQGNRDLRVNFANPVQGSLSGSSVVIRIKETETSPVLPVTVVTSTLTNILPGGTSNEVSPQSVFTGQLLYIFGGQNSQSGLRINTVKIYDPINDAWRVGPSGMPGVSTYGTPVWTGQEVILLDGTSNPNSTGAEVSGVWRFNPISESWTVLSQGASFTGRFDASVVWTGSEVLIWGGTYRNGSYFGTRNDFWAYHPGKDSWRALASGGPIGYVAGASAWTGDKFIVWGGRDTSGITVKSGGVYNLASNSWSTMSTTGAPTGRYDSIHVYHKNKFFIWGGSDGNGARNDGGIYDPAANSWSAIANSNAPGAKIWIKPVIFEGLIGIVGSMSCPSRCQVGGFYNMDNNAWSTFTQAAGSDVYPAVFRFKNDVYTISSGGGAPATKYTIPLDSQGLGTIKTVARTASSPIPKTGHLVHWTGSKALVWGGTSASSGFYDPVADSWSAISTTDAPTYSANSASVIMQNKFYIYSGENFARVYNLLTDTWTVTSALPVNLGSHIANSVSTGRYWVVFKEEGAIKGAIYDTFNDQWKSLTVNSFSPVQNPSTAGAAVYMNGKIYYHGGRDFTNGNVLNSLYSLSFNDADFANVGNTYVGTWTALASSAQTREQHQAVATPYGMFLYPGQINGTSNGSTNAEIYNPTSNSWSTLNSFASGGVLPEVRFGKLVWTGNKVLVNQEKGPTGASDMASNIFEFTPSVNGSTWTIEKISSASCYIKYQPGLAWTGYTGSGVSAVRYKQLNQFTDGKLFIFGGEDIYATQAGCLYRPK